MRSITRILKWENTRRLAVLIRFRGLLVDYRSGTTYTFMADGPIETEDAKRVRVQVNREVDEVRRIIWATAIVPAVNWTPPATVGGYAQTVDLLQNLFNLHRFQIPFDVVYDYIDRALGMYEHNATAAAKRVWERAQ